LALDSLAASATSSISSRSMSSVGSSIDVSRYVLLLSVIIFVFFCCKGIQKCQLCKKNGDKYQLEWIFSVV
jgi:hypothetical protein